jgi:DNA polymerase III epsilon subunit-like protein
MKNHIIVWDTETTSLVKPSPSPLKDQPSIIEFAAVKVTDDEEMTVVDQIEFKCKPPQPLSEDLKKFHKKSGMVGLSDAELENEKKFPIFYLPLCHFFFGTWKMIAHNVAFDRNLLKFELMRMEKPLNFPWPVEHICTVEATYSFKGYRLSLEKLYFDLFAKEMKHEHRAMSDVMHLLECVRELRKRGIV